MKSRLLLSPRLLDQTAPPLTKAKPPESNSPDTYVSNTIPGPPDQNLILLVIDPIPVLFGNRRISILDFVEISPLEKNTWICH